MPLRPKSKKPYGVAKYANDPIITAQPGYFEVFPGTICPSVRGITIITSTKQCKRDFPPEWIRRFERLDNTFGTQIRPPSHIGSIISPRQVTIGLPKLEFASPADFRAGAKDMTYKYSCRACCAHKYPQHVEGVWSYFGSVETAVSPNVDKAMHRDKALEHVLQCPRALALLVQMTALPAIDKNFLSSMFDDIARIHPKRLWRVWPGIKIPKKSVAQSIAKTEEGGQRVQAWRRQDFD
ncbi:hypothetical protein BT63DRAFT_54340 [Microthyrium microscopicum]|uniref:Uncharacterized protein n=1 Tax=Microthyrium microscopicum TaxID=703497 RepID=A0A6A6U1U5_9PEZI|nr:hypothetical protein BT63DRAFT_54340 [Microthyrium microscopicum]